MTIHVPKNQFPNIHVVLSVLVYITIANIVISHGTEQHLGTYYLSQKYRTSMPITS